MGNNLLDTYGRGIKNAPACPDGPGRLWSLLDIMKVFNSQGFSVLLRDLQRFQTECRDGRARASRPAFSLGLGSHPVEQVKPTPQFLEDVKKFFVNAHKLCEATKLPAATAKLDLTNIRLKQQPDESDFSSLLAEFQNAEDMIMSDFWKQKFFRVDIGHAWLIDNPKAFGEEVSTKFPNAVPDIVGAANCLAADCNTAAVFHLMRAVEWGLRALAVNLGLRRLKTRRKPGAPVKLTPLSHAQWEEIMNQLHPRVDAKLNKLRPGPVKQALQEFYVPLLQDVRGFRDGFRIHTMHSRREYTASQAVDQFNHVQNFMQRLATRVSET